MRDGYWWSSKDASNNGNKLTEFAGRRKKQVGEVFRESGMMGSDRGGGGGGGEGGLEEERGK